MKKIISKISIVLMVAVAVAVWFAWSFVDINSHNNPADTDYKDYSNGNAIIMVSELFN